MSVKSLKRKLRRKLKKHRKLVTVISLLLGAAVAMGVWYFLFNQSFSFAKNVIEAPVERNISEELYIMAPEDKTWLYDSQNLYYEDVFDYIVMHKKSSYSKAITKHDQDEWLKNYYLHFGFAKDTSNYLYPDRISTPEIPVTISVELAEQIATYCGLDLDTTYKLITRDIKNHK